MKAIKLIVLLILIMPYVMGAEEIITNQVTIKTTNETVSVSIEGGNSISLNCVEGQEIMQNLSVVREVECQTSEGGCDERFYNFSDNFALFTDSYKNFIDQGYKNCQEAKESNKEKHTIINGLNSTVKKCELDLEQYKLDKDELETKYEECNNKPTYDCSSEKEEYENSKWKWLGAGLLLGAIGYYGYSKVQAAKSPGVDLPPR